MRKVIHALLLAGLLAIPSAPALAHEISPKMERQERRLEALDHRLQHIDEEIAEVNAELAVTLRPRQRERLEERLARLEERKADVMATRDALLGILCLDPVMALTLPGCGSAGW